MKLISTDVDSTSWTTDGKQGYWHAVGFGSKTMSSPDIIMCQYLHTGTAKPASFQCIDTKSTSEVRPVSDAQQDVTTVNSTATFRTSGSSTLVTLEATFDRLLATNDTKDQTLTPGSTINSVWARGKMTSGLSQEHAGSQRGAWTIAVQTPPTIETIVNSNGTTTTVVEPAKDNSFSVTLSSLVNVILFGILNTLYWL
ncbi:hypothetical protein FGO68_gene178 [Halteria grandinella]|uniref:DOMON domain-containing protein n=1 Tax=Halteria grandinella TaxID=5974 RepID=A0A8J8SZP9_HALGN|nr:hypothetical protein FGO68_gene178 [Halteria grandinella]